MTRRVTDSADIQTTHRAEFNSLATDPSPLDWCLHIAIFGALFQDHFMVLWYK